MSEINAFPLDMEPNPELCLEAMGQVFAAHLACDERLKEEERIGYLPEEDRASRLELLDVMYPLPEPSDLAGEAVVSLFERDVAAYHFQNQNSLDFLCQHRDAELSLVRDMIMETYQPDESYARDYLVIPKTDITSRKIHNDAMDLWKLMLADVARLNGWTTYSPDIDDSRTRAEELPLYVTDGNATAYFYVNFWPYEDISVLRHDERSPYNMPKSRIRKWAKLTRGVEITKMKSSDELIFALEWGRFSNIKQMPSIDELTFFQKALAAYY